jgi:cobalamin biosynthetic protein CobC
VVVNPNNPDGRLLGRADLVGLADDLDRRGGLLVVDEAFMDVVPDGPSLAAETGRRNVVVLRSFGKFFGLAGIRLGFALAHPETAAWLAGDLGPWAVSGPALELGLAGLADRDWQHLARERLAEDARRLDSLLAGAGLTVRGGTALFRFAVYPDAAGFAAWLGARGILVRTFSWSATALRVGIPGAESEWLRLEEAASQWRDSIARREDNAA